MTHDELLAKFENWGVEHPYVQPWKDALFEVVKLHKPQTEEIMNSLLEIKIETLCNVCGFEPYPCPTIQAIEKELG